MAGLSYIVRIKYYMISIALTKAVVWKGKIRVSHSQWAKIAKRSAAVEPRKTSHQRPLYFFVCSIFKILHKNKVRTVKQKTDFLIQPILFQYKTGINKKTEQAAAGSKNSILSPFKAVTAPLKAVQEMKKEFILPLLLKIIGLCNRNFKKHVFYNMNNADFNYFRINVCVKHNKMFSESHT